MNILNLTETPAEEYALKAPPAWAKLECATCGRPVGPEAAGSTECLVCTIQSA